MKLFFMDIVFLLVVSSVLISTLLSTILVLHLPLWQAVQPPGTLRACPCL